MDAQGHLMPVNDAFHIYDTTLRDGAQQDRPLARWRRQLAAGPRPAPPSGQRRHHAWHPAQRCADAPARTDQ